MDEASTDVNGRDPVTGYFRPGNKLSKGNAVARRTRELRQAIFDCVTDNQVKAVMLKMCKQAVEEGDTTAARVFLEYTVGKPSQAVEISGPEGSALDLPTIVGVISLALGDDQDARGRVAAAFRRMETKDGLGAAGLGG